MKGSRKIMDVENKKVLSKLRDQRSYKEVVVGGVATGDHPRGTRGVVSGLNGLESKRKDMPDFNSCHGKEAVMSDKVEERFDLVKDKRVGGNSTDILVVKQLDLDSDVGWLSSCAIGIVKDCYIPMEIKEGIDVLGFSVQVCPLGGCSVLLRFDLD
ncbi:hypothetical protein PTKIN_Ptkin01aG0008600 [Pterospermum kingtungense]